MHLPLIVKTVNPLVAHPQNNCHLNCILRPHPTGNQWREKMEITYKQQPGYFVCINMCIIFNFRADSRHVARI